LIAAVVGLAAAGGGAWWAWGRPDEAPTWRTATLERQDVRQVVSATGTLEAVQTVEVGAQVSGIVAALGADFNDRVEAGQVLARIDPALLSADVASASARMADMMEKAPPAIPARSSKMPLRPPPSPPPLPIAIAPSLPARAQPSPCRCPERL
jgi:multidrug efflux pump subunit AcrA (membrane-fusion protein)